MITWYVKSDSKWKLNSSCKKCISLLLFSSPSLPIYYKYLPLFHCYFVFLHNQLVHSSTRPLVTLSSSTINLFTRQLVPLSTRPLVTLSFVAINLFTRLLVPLLLCLSSQLTCLLVHSFTCPLPPRVYYLRNILPFSLLICFFLLTLPTLIKAVRSACWVTTS